MCPAADWTQLLSLRTLRGQQGHLGPSAFPLGGAVELSRDDACTETPGSPFGSGLIAQTPTPQHLLSSALMPLLGGKKTTWTH